MRSHACYFNKIATIIVIAFSTPYLTFALEKLAPIESYYSAYVHEGYPSYLSKNQFGFCLRAAKKLESGIIVATANLIQTSKPYIAHHESPEHAYVAIMGFNDNHEVIWGKVRGKWAFCNHSCDPNCDLNSQWYVITNRTIQQDEELTTAYDAYIAHIPWSSTWNFECKCNAVTCKKIIANYRTDILHPTQQN